MDSRLGLESAGAAYFLDSAAGQGFLRSGSGFAPKPHMNILGSAAGSLPPPNALGGYLDRDMLAMQQISGGAPGRGLYDLSQLNPAPLQSLSSGQGYYTLESLEGNALTQGGGLGSFPQLLLQDRERSIGLGQRASETSMLSAALQKGPGQLGLASSVPPFGTAASAPYLASHLPQELDAGKLGLVNADLGAPSYLPERTALELLAPHNSLRQEQELELRRHEGMILAELERRRLLEQSALGHDAHIREAQLREAQLREVQLLRDAQLFHDVQLREAHIREAQIREAQIREAQIREAREAQLRDARISESRMRESHIRERSLERHDRRPYSQRSQGLSSSYRRNDHQDARGTFCSVCQLECNSRFNLKSHLQGKRHKLMLEGADEDGKKKTEKSEDEKENADAEDGTMDAEVEGKVNGGEKTVSKVDGKKVEGSKLGKRSTSDDGKVNTASKKSKSDRDGFVSKAAGNRLGAGAASRNAFRCEMCNVNCSGDGDLKSHLGGKRHATQLELLQAVGVKVQAPKEADKDHISTDNLKEDATD